MELFTVNDQLCLHVKLLSTSSCLHPQGLKNVLNALLTSQSFSFHVFIATLLPPTVTPSARNIMSTPSVGCAPAGGDIIYVHLLTVTQSGQETQQGTLKIISGFIFSLKSNWTSTNMQKNVSTLAAQSQVMYYNVKVL